MKAHCRIELFGGLRAELKGRSITRFQTQKTGILLAYLAFYRYRDPDSVTGKAVALMRHGYGGHPLHQR